MVCKDVLAVIESAYPAEYALEWDNVGLLAGRDDGEVKSIYIAVDATDEVIREAVCRSADLLITHHPLIFGGMKRITNRDFIGRRLLELIHHDISCYAMHTNYDVLRMAKLSADMMRLEGQEVLEVTRRGMEAAKTREGAGSSEGTESSVEGIGRIGQFETPVTLRQCCEEVKKAFRLDGVRAFGDLEGQVERIAICPGSGKSVIQEALRKKADVLITGDIGHHEGIDAAAQGMAVIDAGHYGIEWIFVEDMERYLAENLSGVEIMTASLRHPFASV